MLHEYFALSNPVGTFYVHMWGNANDDEDDNDNIAVYFWL